jgi:hypothetical protein
MPDHQQDAGCLASRSPMMEDAVLAGTFLERISGRASDLPRITDRVDVDPQKLPNSLGDAESCQFNTRRNHHCEPRPRFTDFLGGRTPQKLAVESVKTCSGPSACPPFDFGVERLFTAVSDNIHEVLLDRSSSQHSAASGRRHSLLLAHATQSRLPTLPLAECSRCFGLRAARIGSYQVSLGIWNATLTRQARTLEGHCLHTAATDLRTIAGGSSPVRIRPSQLLPRVRTP